MPITIPKEKRVAEENDEKIYIYSEEYLEAHPEIKAELESLGPWEHIELKAQIHMNILDILKQGWPEESNSQFRRLMKAGAVSIVENFRTEDERASYKATGGEYFSCKENPIYIRIGKLRRKQFIIPGD